MTYKVPVQLIINNINNIDIAGVEGTIWNGSSKLVNINDTRLHNLRWHINLYSLFLFRVDATIIGNSNSGTFRSNLSIRNNKIYLNDTLADFSLSEFYRYLPISQVNGSISARLSQIEINNSSMPIISGELFINNLNAPLIYTTTNNERVELGDYKVIFFNDGNESIRASITNLENNPIQVQGTLNISQNKSYEISGLIKSSGNQNTALIQGIELMTGSPDSSGFRSFNFTGTL